MSIPSFMKWVRIAAVLLLCFTLHTCVSAVFYIAKGREGKAHQPFSYVLKEDLTPGAEAIWMRTGSFNSLSSIYQLVVSENEVRDIRITAERNRIEHRRWMGERNLPPLPEYPVRTYYVFIDPQGYERREWKVEKDQPNYIFRCTQSDLRLLEHNLGWHRDENNTLMPDGWEPPRKPPRPWYTSRFEIAIMCVYVALGLLVTDAAWRMLRGSKPESTTGYPRSEIIVLATGFSLILLFLVLVSIPPSPRPRMKYEPLLVELSKQETGDRTEYWIGSRVTWVRSVSGQLRSMCDEDDLIHRLHFGDVDPPERIYHVFISPDPNSQQKWNIESDTPNLICRCFNEKVWTVVRHGEFYREPINNELIFGKEPPAQAPRKPGPNVISGTSMILALVMLLIAFHLVRALLWLKAKRHKPPSLPNE